MKNIDETCFQQAIERHEGFVVGMKARMSKSVVGDNGIEPLLKAKQMQKNIDCHLWYISVITHPILMKLPIS